MSPTKPPTPADVLRLARWILQCPLIRGHYALAGGTWLTLRLPKIARPSKDVDFLSPREEISSYQAMTEIMDLCKKEKVSYRITRRGEHFCQIFVSYPGAIETKVDIGKVWHPVTLIYDPELRCPILSSEDMVLEKLHCVIDRIEPTDLYDLCRLHQAYPSEFKMALSRLAETEEISELLIRIQRCLEATDGEGTKETLTKEERQWLESYVSNMIKEMIRMRKMLK
ncbi:MAG: nucleotidyl transferase AbiEii/AbiGii toxin family protein [Candidatus Omnitrophica bacterium]|nr:nucleotidyl transferase AbiEii/AbiGii toxin family protein [Candidatus Omnitrophota bacterium]